MSDGYKQALSSKSKTQLFGDFVRDYRRSAVRLAWRLLGPHRAAAEDVAQHAFAKAWRHIDRYRGEAQLKTWFHRILVNQVRSHLRWISVRERARFFIAKPKIAHPVEQDHAMGDRIEAALKELTQSQREVFTLVYLEGMTIPEAAATLRKAPGTLKSHLFRAVKKLRAELADLEKELST